MLEKIITLDQEIFIMLNNLGTDFWDPFWIFISDQNWMFLLITPIVLYFYYKYDGKKSFYTIFLLLICFGLTNLIHDEFFKKYFMRLRPCHEDGICQNIRLLVDCGGYYSFVSGHAANTAAIISFLLLYFKSINNFIKIGLTLWVVLVGYSRIYLAKHYPLDVFFGFILGFLVAYCCYQIYIIYKQSKIKL